jgi:xylulokinase
MPEPLLFAGLDVSTQSGKLVVIDLEGGRVVHLDRVDYDEDLPSYKTRNGVIPNPTEGVSESDPRMWIEAVEILLGRLSRTELPLDHLCSLSVSGQQHGLVALTRDGKLATPRSKLWNDVSTSAECEFLTESVGGPEAMIQEVGNSQRPGYTAGKILSLLRNDPEAFHQASTFFLVHNYVNWYLTGGREGGVAAMEPGDTSGMALWHPGRGEWSQAVLDAIHPGLEGRLPPVLPSHQGLGTIGPSLAQRHGLPPDCLVDAGSGDNMYGALGTGNVAPGIVTVSLGTSGTAYTFLEEAFIDPAGEIAAFCDSTGHHLPLVCVSNMANGYDALRGRLDLSHEEVTDLYFQADPGCGGRLILPWYEGERTPNLPQAASFLFGFGAADFGPETLCRSVVEGHVLNLWEGFSRLPVDPGEIRVTGGLARSGAWLQALADVFGAEVVPVKGEGAALGAAIHAAWVWCLREGRAETLPEIVDRFVVLDEEARRRPLPGDARTYSLLRKTFRALSKRVRGLDGEDPFALRHQLLDADD